VYDGAFFLSTADEGNMSGLSFPTEIVSAYRRDGYAIVRGLFGREEIAQISQAIDQIHAEGVRHGRSFRHGNLFYNVARLADGEPVVRLVQWPSYHQPLLNAVRLDPRMMDLLAPLIGRDLKQIINQLHWKSTKGCADFAWHQDCRFREPASAYRNLAETYVQTGLAIDPHSPSSGGMRFMPGSHVWGDLGMEIETEVLSTTLSDDALRAVGLDPADAVDVVLEPGDIALWSPFLVHGSGPNRSAHQRRLYINGYVRAEACDRGEWAFREGRPVPFGPEQALVHYEELRSSPGPHYV
jgi:ectoine hydroxylase-related dioxygenase (phytanoyl-CoA dioxygenase family)